MSSTPSKATAKTRARSAAAAAAAAAANPSPTTTTTPPPTTTTTPPQTTATKVTTPTTPAPTSTTTTTTTTTTSSSTATSSSHHTPTPKSEPNVNNKRTLDTPNWEVKKKPKKRKPGPLSIAEEDFIANAFKNVSDSVLTADIRRIKRKFIVKEQQRANGIQPFNIDDRVHQFITHTKKKDQKLQNYYTNDEIPFFQIKSFIPLVKTPQQPPVNPPQQHQQQQHYIDSHNHQYQQQQQQQHYTPPNSTPPNYYQQPQPQMNPQQPQQPYYNTQPVSPHHPPNPSSHPIHPTNNYPPQQQQPLKQNTPPTPQQQQLQTQPIYKPPPPVAKTVPNPITQSPPILPTIPVSTIPVNTTSPATTPRTISPPITSTPPPTTTATTPITSQPPILSTAPPTTITTNIPPTGATISPPAVSATITTPQPITPTVATVPPPTVTTTSPPIVSAPPSTIQTPKPTTIVSPPTINTSPPTATIQTPPKTVSPPMLSTALPNTTKNTKTVLPTLPAPSTPPTTPPTATTTITPKKTTITPPTITFSRAARGGGAPTVEKDLDATKPINNNNNNSTSSSTTTVNSNNNNNNDSINKLTNAKKNKPFSEIISDDGENRTIAYDLTNPPKRIEIPTPKILPKKPSVSATTTPTQAVKQSSQDSLTLERFYHWSNDDNSNNKNQKYTAQTTSSASSTPISTFKKPFQPITELIMGKFENTLLVKPYISPHTTRELKPFIRRDYETCPPKLSILRELYQFFNDHLELFNYDINAGGGGGNLNRSNTPSSPAIVHSIDYRYLTPDLVEKVNLFLCNNFWPGIDVSDILEYPDYTVVAMYRNLIIGCGLMNPDGYIMFISVHPEWQGQGIASFMLYHLTQTMVGKDITLHVSTNNSALTLYHKFGFKVEEHITNFYDKYYSDQSGKSKNAYLLRLRR
ncbi:hypothetical protein CYY_002654 [Polysphondylium violaceum]|uniref:N-acetyltransferase domain-containing protein n=1 Tax=Polysphondylium violaceum TaxID=133409 RepID=A0A8J4PYZ3_9MYCE|nr:hypothetical protein CYY_002654 [Polysphondylium violaceum]